MKLLSELKLEIERQGKFVLYNYIKNLISTQQNILKEIDGYYHDFSTNFI